MVDSMSGRLVKPAGEPRLRFTASTPSFTQSSRAARISSSAAPVELSPNTFITTSCAWGATPEMVPSAGAPAMVPATWVPW